MSHYSALRIVRSFAMLLAATCLLAAGVAASGTSAQAQASDYDLTVLVEEAAGDTVTVAVQLTPRAPLGALEGSLTFDPDVLEPSSCDFVGELGACNALDDHLRFSALFLEGLSEPSTVMRVTFSSRSNNTTTTIDFADVEGFDVATAPLSVTLTPGSLTTGAESTNPLFIALPAIAIVSLVGIGALAVRNRRS